MIPPLTNCTFPPITNREGFTDVVEILDADDGTPIDLTGWTIQVAIRSCPYPNRTGDYWPTAFAFGFDGAQRLLATTADGSVTIPTLGVFIFTFTPAQIASLCPGHYVFAANIASDGEAVQLWLGELPVLDGVVPQ
jgi:hypothetical protein